MLALAPIAFSAAEAAAVTPSEPNRHPGIAPAKPSEPTVIRVPVDDSVVEVIQAGTSAVAGASLALGAMWVYRRRERLAV